MFYCIESQFKDSGTDIFKKMCEKSIADMIQYANFLF